MGIDDEDLDTSFEARFANPVELSTANQLFPPPERIMQFFEYEHLPKELQHVSKQFADLAVFITTLPRNPERTVALRKLLEAKDAAVRARLAK